MSPILFAVFGAVLVFLGFMLVLKGALWDPSRGRPRCPDCWFSLEGAASSRCPECGADYSEARSLYRTRRSYRLIAAGIVATVGGACVVTARHGLHMPWSWVPDPLLVRLLPYAESPAWREFTGRSNPLTSGYDLGSLTSICERTIRRNSDAEAKRAAVALASEIVLAGESSAIRVLILALADATPSVVDESGRALLNLGLRSVSFEQSLPELIRLAKGATDNTGDGRAAFHATAALMTIKYWPCEFGFEVASLYRVESPATRLMVASALRSMAASSCDVTAAIEELERFGAVQSSTEAGVAARLLAGSLRKVRADR